MRVNIYTEGSKNWGLLRRMSMEIAHRLKYVTINKDPGDINYFVNYALYRPVKGVTVGHFTHLEIGGPFRQRFEDVARKVDYHTGTSMHSARLLTDMGIPGCVVISPGTDLQREVIFGVCGQVKASGRKGEYLVEKMVNDGYTVKAWGQGWPCEIVSSDLKDRRAFYEMIDYFVVTAINEGGPVPVAEAIGMGVPVIAPDVGWCWEFPVYRYKKGQWASLEPLLRMLTHPPTWKDWAMGHHDLFKKIKREKNL
jgi:hypothetical protein